MLPLARALEQFDDRAFLGVVAASVLWSAGCFAGLGAGSFWLVQQVVQGDGVLAWVAGLAGALAAGLLSLWLFLPLAAGIGLFYSDTIAAAVERRYYPWLPPPAGESLAVQAWDGVVVAAKVLGLNAIGLLLAIALPGAGLVLGWAIAAYAIGRGLFVAVAMRRMPRFAAEATYRANRAGVLMVGAVLALAAYVPVMNLFVPVIGVAAMVHLLDTAMQRGG